MTEFKMHHKFYRELVFLAGVIATIAYRIIIFLNYLPSHFWSDLVWYIGTIGFVWYFAHRYNIERRRSMIIKERGLEAKVETGQTLSNDDRQALVQTLTSLESSKAQLNYIVIFVASGIALIIDIAIRLAALFK
jgi:Ca2+/Na+ antiporter